MLKLFRNTIYIRLKASKISLLHVESESELNLIPEIAIETSAYGRSRILAVGNEASAAKTGKSNVRIANGFKHPRTLIADFTIAELTLKYCLNLLTKKSLFFLSPLVIIQPLEMDEGGYTQVELRAFEELCNRIGTRKTYVRVGAELTKDDLLMISEKGSYDE